ncbi:hypothetical protein [Actinokineospora spheciospongiae]|nr:hypothetical protein [Actinokineospora spheciospongiae]PWW59541.1 hypothetical protein DFQ13_108178 [Actinokineospora spheciospongiae]
MRIVCFVLGVLCLLGSAGFVALGTLNLDGGGSSSRPATSNFRVQGVVVHDEPNLDDFGPATTLAGVLAVAGVAWMVGAVAFAPGRAAAAPQQQWQAPQYGPPQQYPPSGPVPQQAPPQQQAYPPQAHGQQPPQSG